MPDVKPLLPLFDHRAADDARDEAMSRVATNAPGDWQDRALAAVRTVARRREFFTTDAVQWILGEDIPPEPRAWGPIMRRAAQQGWVQKTNRMRKSVKASCHRREKAIWKSLLCGLEVADDERANMEGRILSGRRAGFGQ